MSEPDQLPDRTAASLMQLASVGEPRPIDMLLDRLTDPDGAQWFNQSIRRDSKASVLWPDGRYSSHGVTLERMRSLKQHAKVIAGAGGFESTLRGTGLYFTATGVARVVLDQRISSHDDTVLAPIFADLSEAVPSPWRELFDEAARACASTDQRPDPRA
jgi:hypothetical protein